MKKLFPILFIFCLIIMGFSQGSFGQSSGHGGSLYWMKSPQGCFLYENGDMAKPNPKCKVEYGKQYDASSFDTPLMVFPNQNYYFKGFADSKGNPLQVKSKNYSILKITIHGQSFYDYFLAKDNPIYKNLTPYAYYKIVNTYVKGIYGTTSFKVIGQVTGYFLDPNKGLSKAVFKEKSDPKLNVPKAISKGYIMSHSFFLLDDVDLTNISFKSSNPKVCKIDKNTGEVEIKGEGISTIVTTLKPTEKVKGKTYETTVKILPPKVRINGIKKKSSQSVQLNWEKDQKASGYTICISNKSSFKSSKNHTVTSSKKGSHIIKELKAKTRYYVKIRSYKRSCGQKLNGKWSNVVTIKL